MKLYIFIGKNIFRTYSQAELGSKIITGMLLFTFGTGIFVVHFTTSSTQPQSSSPKSLEQVLGAQTQKLTGSFNVNIPSFFNSNLYLKGDLLVNGQASVSGNLTAPNILYSLNAGNGISVSGGQNPVIINSGVTSIGGQSGDIKLSSGQGITVDGLNLVNSDPGSSQNIFKTIKIGSDTFSAGNNNDTLTFSAGNGISISPDADNKTITISNTSQSEQTGWVLTGTNITPVDSSYLVGIGTDTPTEKLDVNGNIKVSGTTSFNNVAYSWPTTAGNSGYLLQSDGTGGLSWAPVTGGGNVTTGGGTSGSLPKFTSTFGLGNSAISDNGSLVNIGENFKVTGSSITFSAFTAGVAQFNSSGILTSGPINVAGGVKLYHRHSSCIKWRNGSFKRKRREAQFGSRFIRRKF